MMQSPRPTHDLVNGIAVTPEALVPRLQSFGRGQVGGVDERYQRRRHPVIPQLPSHLYGHQAAERITQQAKWLAFARLVKFFDITGGQCFDGGKLVDQTERLESEQ